MTFLLQLLTLACSLGSAQTLSEPQFFLGSEDYKTDAISINDMFRNVAGDIQKLKKEVDANDITDTSSFLTVHSSPTWSGVHTFVAAASVTVKGDFFGLPVSSQTVQAIDWTGTNTTFGVCNTTLTVTTNGSPIRLVWTGHLTNAGTAESTFGTILQDGGFISPFSQTLAMTFYKDGNGTNIGGNDGVISLVITPSAGTHSYCLAFRGSGGITWTVENDQRPSVFRIEGAN